MYSTNHRTNTQPQNDRTELQWGTSISHTLNVCEVRACCCYSIGNGSIGLKSWQNGALRQANFSLLTAINIHCSVETCAIPSTYQYLSLLCYIMCSLFSFLILWLVNQKRSANISQPACELLNKMLYWCHRRSVLQKVKFLFKPNLRYIWYVLYPVPVAFCV
jgi:hypothetical protein